MSRTVSAQALEDALSEESDEVWLTLMTIVHPALAEPLRFVNNNEDVLSQGRLFLGMPFSIEFPESAADRPGEARLKVDNVDRLIVDTIRSITDPPVVSFEVIMASTPNTVEMRVDNLTLRNTTFNKTEVSGTLRFEQITAEPVCEQITPERFPGLF